MMDERIQKWIRWLDAIEWDVQSLVLYKSVFWELQQIIDHNKDIQLNSAFYRYMGDTFVAYAAIGVRRHVKINEDSISLARLLSEISNDPSRITLGYFLGLQSDSQFHPFMEGGFRQYCEEGENYVSPLKVQEDLGRLKEIAHAIEDFADKRIAHRDSRELKELPVFTDLNKSIEELDKLFIKYNHMLKGVSMNSLMPTFQYDWKAIFRIAWIKSNSTSS
jgi:hypothetical protein